MARFGAQLNTMSSEGISATGNLFTMGYRAAGRTERPFLEYRYIRIA